MVVRFISDFGAQWEGSEHTLETEIPMCPECRTLERYFRDGRPLVARQMLSRRYIPRQFACPCFAARIWSGFSVISDVHVRARVPSDLFSFPYQNLSIAPAVCLLRKDRSLKELMID